MDEALRLTEQERAFVHGQHQPASTEDETARVEERADPVRKFNRSTTTRSGQTKRPRRSKRAKRAGMSTNDAAFVGDLLLPITTRLSLDTANTLRRACLERKLGRKRPCTQQEVIESAVRTWLAQNGYSVR